MLAKQATGIALVAFTALMFPVTWLLSLHVVGARLPKQLIQLDVLAFSAAVITAFREVITRTPGSAAQRGDRTSEPAPDPRTLGAGEATDLNE